MAFPFRRAPLPAGPLTQFLMDLAQRHFDGRVAVVGVEILNDLQPASGPGGVVDHMATGRFRVVVEVEAPGNWMLPKLPPPRRT